MTPASPLSKFLLFQGEKLMFLKVAQNDVRCLKEMGIE